MSRIAHFLAIGFLPFAVAACVNPGTGAAGPGASTAVALGEDLGSSASRAPQDPRAAVAGEGHEGSTSIPGGVQVAHAGRKDAHAAGTVNAVDAAQHKLNISHDPIPEIGWPAMTMEFTVVPSVDLSRLKPGTRINFTIEQGQGGMYRIQSIAPAGGVR